jgi:hypothetical protein
MHRPRTALAHVFFGHCICRENISVDFAGIALGKLAIQIADRYVSAILIKPMDTAKKTPVREKTTRLCSWRPFVSNRMFRLPPKNSNAFFALFGRTKCKRCTRNQVTYC